MPSPGRSRRRGVTSSAARSRARAPPAVRCGTSPTARSSWWRRDRARRQRERRRCRHAAPGRRRATRNSTLPSAPRSGDAHHVDHDAAPASARPSATSREHLDGARPGRARSPPLPDPGPARLELRLHQQHEIAVGRRAARQSAGATVRSEMNERSATADVDRRRRACSASRWRTLVRSSTTTRGSSRSDHASCPRPDVDRVTWRRARAAAGSR